MRIISPWRDRRGYVIIMLATLKEAMRGHDDVTVVMYNNESTCGPPPMSYDFGDQLVHKQINSRKPSVSHACHHVYIDMIEREFQECDDQFLVNIDSDCCVHPLFIVKAKKMIKDLPYLGMASLYSEGNHPEPTEWAPGFEGEYHVRSHVSMTASIINRNVWERFPKPKASDEMRAFWEQHIKAIEHAGGIDGALSSFANETPKRGCFSTRRSYVEHIGAVGQYSTQSADGLSGNHRARRFNP